MNFTNFRDALNENIGKLMKEGRLFIMDVDGDALYEYYLDSFPSGTNEIFRERREHDCSECRKFIKDFGAAVLIHNGMIKSIWDFETGDTTYQTVANAMRDYVLSKPVKNLYFGTTRLVGTESNREISDTAIRTWRHFYTEVPSEYVVRVFDTIDSSYNIYSSRFAAFKRALEDISIDTVKTVLELIGDGVVYRGDQYKDALKKFESYKIKYDSITGDDKKSLFVWEWIINTPDSVARIRNTAIGTFLTNIENGDDVDVALRKYEDVTAPANYKRPKSVYTKVQLENAKKTITELGYMNSLRRRFANLDDISVNNLLFVNSDAAHRVKGGDDLFSELSKSVQTKPKKYVNTPTVDIQKFISDVLPTATSVELLFEPRLHKNLCSLVAPVDSDAPSMFKWDNPFSWAYSGNIADSSLKQNVKKAGGKVDGYMRFSIQWNDTDPTRNSNNDVDAHCYYKETMKNTSYTGHIYFGHKRSFGGELDVDMQWTEKGVPAVENITWAKKELVKDGVYRFKVNQYAYRGGDDGFRAEFEINGDVYRYDYNHTLHGSVDVVTVVVKDGKYEIKHKLNPIDCIGTTKWNVVNNSFVPVTAIMLSPNYWDGNKNGNKHYIFALDGCVNDENPNAWYNEYLKDELVKDNRRVMEALGSKAHVEDAEDQISGLGFSSTQRETFTVKVKGATERIMRVTV